MLKKTLLFTGAFLSIASMTTTQAFCPRGLYSMINVGYSDVDYNKNFISSITSQAPNATIVPTSNSTQNRWGVGVGGGYQWNDFFAIDGAFDYFLNKQTSKFTFVAGVSGNGTIVQKDTYALLLLARGIFPLQQGFSVYGRLGGAYVWTKGVANIVVPSESAAVSNSSTNHRFRPAYGLGVDYQICDQFTAYVDWTGIAGNKSKITTDDTMTGTRLNVRTPAVNYFSIGLRYFLG